MNIRTSDPKEIDFIAIVFSEYYSTNTYIQEMEGPIMPKVSFDMPQELVDDLRLHVGDEHKFVSLADAIRTACRKLLDQLDSIDIMHGRRSE